MFERIRSLLSKWDAPRLIRVKETEQVIADLYSKVPDRILKAVKQLEKSSELRKAIHTDDTLAQIPKDSLAPFKESKSPKEIFFHFFGMDKNWSLGRNLLGGFMVHAPEYPTYFIPAYTQAKATGDAHQLKKGEGPRGLITGGLEGIAVGALVSGNKLNPKEMIPYIILGAGLQLFSSKFFPWLGEKAGRYQYNKKQALHPQTETASTKLNIVSKAEPVKTVDTTKFAAPTLKGANPYSAVQSSGMKV